MEQAVISTKPRMHSFGLLVAMAAGLACATSSAWTPNFVRPAANNGRSVPLRRKHKANARQAAKRRR